MTDVPRCSERVPEPPHYLHTHVCDRRAPYVVFGDAGPVVVCGIHRRKFLSRGYTEREETP